MHVARGPRRARATVAEGADGRWSRRWRGGIGAGGWRGWGERMRDRTGASMHGLTFGTETPGLDMARMWGMRALARP